jgi:hypothetical protein
VTERVCQTGDCLENYHARGYCLKHYQALWRAEAKLEPAERERIKEKRKSQKHDTQEFWEFVKEELGING